jgi:hypothetical protein
VGALATVTGAVGALVTVTGAAGALVTVTGAAGALVDVTAAVGVVVALTAAVGVVVALSGAAAELTLCFTTEPLDATRRDPAPAVLAVCLTIGVATRRVVPTGVAW